MSVKEAPLAKVKRLHGTKEKLVDSLVPKLAEDSDESKGELKQRLLSVSNQKLLRLADAWQTMEEKYGSKAKLVQSISTARGKAKDEDYCDKLSSYSVPHLLDMARSAS